MKNRFTSLVMLGVMVFSLLFVAQQAQASSNSVKSSISQSIAQLKNSLNNLLLSMSQTSAAIKAQEAIDSIKNQINVLESIVDENTGEVKLISKPLKFGDKGGDVEILQIYLASQPEYKSQLVTGYYGAMTVQLVSKFQEKNNIEVTGSVGPKTLAFINKDLTEKGASNIDTFPASDLSEYTVALLNTLNDFKQAPINKKENSAIRLANIVEKRKNVILEQIKTDPSSVITNTLSPEVISSIPQNLLTLIEKKSQISGKFEHIHIHYGDFETGTTAEEYYVTDSSTNKRFRINLKGSPQALTDDIVTVDGTVLDDQFATSEELIKVTHSNNKSVSSKSNTNTTLLSKIKSVFSPEVANATIVTQKKSAVIMFNWQNDTRTTFTESSARSTFFTSSNSANAFFIENSFGQEELIGKLRADGDVYGWVTIPYDNTNCSSMYNTWATAAETALQASGVNLTGYNIKTYIFPSVSCGWSGLAYIGGDPSRSWVTGTSLGVITHELGHNLGAHHASSWSCTENGSRVSISTNTNCVLGEYGDPFDVMGAASSMKHLNNYQKGISMSGLNWLTPQNTQTIDRNTAPDATYVIAPIETSSTGVQSLRIPREISNTGSVLDYYYLEFRQPFGFDNFASNNAVVNGVSIRIGPGYSSTTQSKLIDTTPETSTFSDAPLAVGKTFTDPYKSINVNTLSVSPSGAQVRVTFGALPCIRANPTFVISPSSKSLFIGQSSSYSYTITNNDTSGCSPSVFSITPTLPAGFTQNPASTNLTISGGASASGSFIVNTPSSANTGSYNVVETAQNTSVVSPVYKDTSSTTITILPTDTTPPVVNITSPANGATLSKGKFSISASASDANGIAEIQLLLDGNILKTCYNVTSCLISVNVKSLTKGSHTIVAQATDAGGPVANVATSSVVINK